MPLHFSNNSGSLSHRFFTLATLLMSLAIVPLAAQQTPTPTEGEQQVNENGEEEACLNSAPAETCDCNSSGTGTTASPQDGSTCVASVIDNVTFRYTSDVLEYTANPNASDGCAPCGTAGITSEPSVSYTMPSLEIRRIIRPDTGGFSNLGPGVFTNFDLTLTMYASDWQSGEKAVHLTLPQSGIPKALVFSRSPADGVYYPLRPKNFVRGLSGIRFYDAAGNQVMAHDDPNVARAVLTRNDGHTYGFEIFYTWSTRRARLDSYSDRNGNSVQVRYHNAAGTSNSFSTMRKISEVEDAYGRIAQFSYHPSTISGWYAISQITLPQGQSISYHYDDPNFVGLSRIEYPDGTTSTFQKIANSNSQCTIYRIFDAREEGTHRRKDVYLSTATWTNPTTGDVLSRSANRTRMVVNGDDEVTYLNWADVAWGVDVNSYIYKGGTSLVRFNSYFGHAVSSQRAITWDINADASTYTWETTHSYETDEYGRISKITDGLGRVSDMTIDDLTSKFNKEVHPDLTETNSAFNQFQQPLTKTDRLGRQSIWAYDAKGNLLSKTLAAGTPESGTWTWTYDSRGLPITETDANGNTTDYAYDATGYLISITEAADFSGGTRAIWSLGYDATGRLTSTTDPEQRTTTMTYDSLNRLLVTQYEDTSTETTTYGSGADSNLVVSRSDRNGSLTTISYDGSGRAIETITAAGTPEAISEICTYLTGTELKSTCTIAGEKTTYIYDYNNRLIQTKVQPSVGVELTAEMRYDIFNRVLERTDAYGRRSFTAYDINNRPIRSVRETVPGALAAPAINPGATLAEINAQQNFLLALVRDASHNATYIIIDRVFDAEGQTISEIDARSITTTNSYDQRGRRIQTVEAADTPVARTAEKVYDANSNVIAVRSPRYFDSNDTEGFQKSETTMTYTGRNLLASRTEAPNSSVAATESFTYYLDHREYQRTDARGNVWTKLWHACCGRLQAVIDPTGAGAIYNTDFEGNISHTITASNLPTNLAGYNWHDAIDADTLNEMTARFDARGRMTHQTVWLQPLGIVVDHARADLGNGVIPIAGEDGIPATDGLTTRYTYDDDLSDGIGLDVIYSSYLVGLNLDSDSDGYAVEVTNPENEKTLAIYDGLGRAIKNVDGLGDADAIIYDNIVTITGYGDVVETVSTDALGHINKKRIDGAGRRIELEDAEGRITTFSYDANSNLVSVRDPNGVGKDCVFDALNRDISCTDTQGDTTTRQYDANSNKIVETDALGQNTVCIFDARNRDINCTDRLGAVTSHVYDENNNLLSITDAEGGLTSYTYDDRNLLETEPFQWETLGRLKIQIAMMQLGVYQVV